MAEKFKIITQFVKDMSSETPNVETYLYVKEYIKNYNLNIEITTKPLKNRMIEVSTKLDYMDKGTSGVLHVKLVPTYVRTFYNKYGNLLLYLYLLIVSIKIFFVRMKNA